MSFGVGSLNECKEKYQLDLSSCAIRKFTSLQVLRRDLWMSSKLGASKRATSLEEMIDPKVAEPVKRQKRVARIER